MSKSEIKIACVFSKMSVITELRPHPKNRNRHPQDQIDRLVKLIKYQGFRHPIIISTLSGYVVAGHGRLEAAKKIGMKEVPIDYQDFASHESEYAFLTSDNAIASWANLDLSGVNLDLGDLGPDFDINLLGIKDFNLDPMDFDEPEDKKDPSLKEPQLKLCPSCGVVIE